MTARDRVLAEALQHDAIRAGVLRHQQALVWVGDVAFFAPHYTHQGRVLRLGPVFVTESQRGKGLLRQPIIDYCRGSGAKRIMAAILQSNSASQRLFGACGFVRERPTSKSASGFWWRWMS